MSAELDDDDDEGGDATAIVERRELVIAAGEVGTRLDAAIAAHVEASRAQIQKWIDAGHVTVDGAVATKAGARVRLLERIVVAIPAPQVLEVVAEAIPLAIVYEDADLIVVDKPAGLVVHPAPGHARGTLVNALLHHCHDLAGIGGVLRPGIVHRLDKDTSGVMVATKSDRAHAGLVAQFAAKAAGGKAPGTGIERAYLAIASPAPVGARGTIRTLHGRHPVDRKRFSSKVASGRPAVTHWELVERVHEGALVRCVLETGRTHQIRVHASEHGWPLIGDPVYGHKPRDARIAAVAAALGRQALHAAHLAFDHPVTGARLAFDAPLPADLVAALAALRAAP